MNLTALGIIESTACVDQFRFPRSKKKRIRLKWAGQPANFRPSTKAFKMGDKLVCHPQLAAQLRRALA